MFRCEVLLVLILIAAILASQLIGTASVTDGTQAVDENGLPATSTTLEDLEAPGILNRHKVQKKQAVPMGGKPAFRWRKGPAAGGCQPWGGMNSARYSPGAMCFSSRKTRLKLEMLWKPERMAISVRVSSRLASSSVARSRRIMFSHLL